MPAGEPWRLLPYDIGPSARHVALSDALVRVGTRPTVWWHAADRTTLLLGGGQTVRDHVLQAAHRHGVAVVNRHAGGTSVLATPAVLGLDVLLPRNHPLAHPDVVEGYRWLGHVWQITLAALGLPAHLVSVAEARAEAAPPNAIAGILRAACFGTLSPFEVTCDHRKLVGLAQVRRARNVLLQSALHRTFDAEGLVALMTAEGGSEAARLLRQRAAGLDEILDEVPEAEDIQETWERTLETTTGGVLEPGAWTTVELEYATGKMVTEDPST